MAGKKTKGGGMHSMQAFPQRDKTIPVMLIRQEVSHEEFLKALGKWNYPRSQK